MAILDVENIVRHDAYTSIRTRWLEALMAKRADLHAKGYDDQFLRV